VIQQQPSHHLDLPHVADILNQAGSQLIFFQVPISIVFSKSKTKIENNNILMMERGLAIAVFPFLSG
jgi:hypothetical protein